MKDKLKKNPSGHVYGKRLMIIGAVCVLALVLSSWYSVVFNDSRLVVPMDFSSFSFQIKDLPMILSVIIFAVYVFYLFISLFLAAVRRNQAANESSITRRINPRLGYLGFLGFLGFCGFGTYHVDQSVYPFAFFLFFGFFGFYYEGKMSGTFMDERFRENVVRAQLAALKVMCVFTVLAFAVLCQGRLFGNVHYTLIAATVILALALALGLFLSEYLLYRYDHDDQYEETEE